MNSEGRRNFKIFGEEETPTYRLGRLGKFDVWIELDPSTVGDTHNRNNVTFREFLSVLDGIFLTALDFIRSQGGNVYHIYIGEGGGLDTFNDVDLSGLKLVVFVNAIRSYISNLEEAFYSSQNPENYPTASALQSGQKFRSLRDAKMKVVIRELGQDYPILSLADNGRVCYPISSYVSKRVQLRGTHIATVKVRSSLEKAELYLILFLSIIIGV